MVESGYKFDTPAPSAVVRLSLPELSACVLGLQHYYVTEQCLMPNAAVKLLDRLTSELKELTLRSVEESADKSAVPCC